MTFHEFSMVNELTDNRTLLERVTTMVESYSYQKISSSLLNQVGADIRHLCDLMQMFDLDDEEKHLVTCAFDVLYKLGAQISSHLFVSSDIFPISCKTVGFGRRIFHVPEENDPPV